MGVCVEINQVLDFVFEELVQTYTTHVVLLGYRISLASWHAMSNLSK